MSSNGKEKNKTTTKQRTVKIDPSSHENLQELINGIKRDGWASVGASREDTATIANVIDEALRGLLAKRQPAARRA